MMPLPTPMLVVIVPLLVTNLVPALSFRISMVRFCASHVWLNFNSKRHFSQSPLEIPTSKTRDSTTMEGTTLSINRCDREPNSNITAFQEAIDHKQGELEHTRNGVTS